MLPILKPPKTNLDELARIQREVAKRVVKRGKPKKLETIAGCDISFTRENRAYAACAILDYSSLGVLKYSVTGVKVKFPYIPTFLAFRELEPMLKVIRGMEADVYMVGAQGLAHPRRAGLASHLGVILKQPTLGVAKSRLCGDAEVPSDERGAYTLLKDRGEIIGAVVRTRPSVQPVYVSIGHKLSLEIAIRTTLETAPKYRLPEPIRSAHRIATDAMKKEMG
ncbi:MAG: endonuclease V [Candidatus Hadarchaeota archaeon]|nr:endonuclease V [Candidatus Hadarchaeota archaeon]